MDDSRIIRSDLAHVLNVTEGSAAHDATAKRLVANKAILAYILKYTMKEFAGISVKEIPKYIEGNPKISKVAVPQDHADAEAAFSPEDEMMSGSERIDGASTEDKSITEGSVYYDIRFIAQVPKDGDLMEIIINVEIQNNDTPGYPIVKRGIYYGSRMISSQRGTVFTKQHYERIKKVASIWICVDTEKKISDAINVYHFCESIEHGDYTEAHEHYDLMRVVVIRLGADGVKSSNPMIRLLSKLFSQTISKEEKIDMLPMEFGIEITETIRREVDTMCNLSVGIYDKGMREGARRFAFGLVRQGKMTLLEGAQETNTDLLLFEKGYEEYLQEIRTNETAQF